MGFWENLSAQARESYEIIFGLRQFGRVEKWTAAGSELHDTPPESGVKRCPRGDEDANVILSAASLDFLPDQKGGGWHQPLLDIDFPVYAIPSTTPGHYHLYFSNHITWEKYKVLLQALADAGIIEPGYAASSIKRGFTAVRLPWVQKEVGQE